MKFRVLFHEDQGLYRGYNLGISAMDGHACVMLIILNFYQFPEVGLRVKHTCFLQDSVLLETPLVNLKNPNVNLVIKAGSRAFLKNGSDTDVIIKQGLTICGFGKGKFKNRTENPEENAAKEVLFDILPETQVPNKWHQEGTLTILGWIFGLILVKGASELRLVFLGLELAWGLSNGKLFPSPSFGRSVACQVLFGVTLIALSYNFILHVF